LGAAVVSAARAGAAAARAQAASRIRSLFMGISPK
jgi:hypothetical protein